MAAVVPRADSRRPVGPLVALLALVVLATIALRGTLPTVAPAVSEARPDSSAPAWIGLITLLSASLLITAVALLTRSSGRTTAPVEDDRWSGAGAGPWSVPRVVLFVLGAVTLWVLIFLLLNYLQHLWQPQAPDNAPVPTQSPRPSPAQAPGETTTRRPDDRVLSYLAATVMAMAMLMVAGAVVAGRRRRRAGETAPPDVEADAEVPNLQPGQLAAAAERGLTAIEDLSLAPREAIIACYVAMEQALAGAPGAAPQDSDTPSEVLARAVHIRAVRADSAATLVRLFAEARFSTHVMTERHREVAERALRTVLDELRSTS